MAAEKLEARVAALEAEVARLRAKIEQKDKPESDQPWWQKIVGMFENDPLHDEAVRLGRQYRESLRPKPSKKKTQKKKK